MTEIRKIVTIVTELTTKRKYEKPQNHTIRLSKNAYISRTAQNQEKSQVAKKLRI